MSERGSFVTEYIYCDRCFGLLKEALLPWREKRLHAFILPDFPIIAGKVGGSYPYAQIEIIEETLKPVEAKLCCRLRLAIVREAADSTVEYAFGGGENPIIKHMVDEAP